MGDREWTDEEKEEQTHKVKATENEVLAWASQPHTQIAGRSDT